VTLGFIRSGIFYIDRTVHGRRFRVSTGCKTTQAAFAEYVRFEKDPFHYNPRSSTGTTWKDEGRGPRLSQVPAVHPRARDGRNSLPTAYPLNH
jgi:hypothetical protein